MEGFLHFSLTWVRAEEGSISSLALANYVDREGKRHNNGRSLGIEDVNHTKFTVNEFGRTVDISDYIDRKGRHSTAQHDELGESVLVTCGLPVTTGQELARALDARERKSDRTYRQYGGRMPRVASHLIASFSYGMTPDQAGHVVRTFATALSKRLNVPLYGRIHNKNGQPDHAHLVIGTRTVTRGKLGAKARALDAVSEKIVGHSIDIGTGKSIGATCEWMRAKWAQLLREATQDHAIDHRSYARRGLNIVPVTHVPRARIDREKRENTTAWRDHRRGELETRLQSGSPQSADLTWKAAASHSSKERNTCNPEPTIQNHESETQARTLEGTNLGPANMCLSQDSLSVRRTPDGLSGIESLKEFSTAVLKRQKESPNVADEKADRSPLNARSDYDTHLNISTGLQGNQANTATSTRDDHVAPPVTQDSKEVEAAVDLYRRLKQLHRLSGARSRQLSASVGMDLNDFETRARARSEGDGSRAFLVPSASSLPLPLWTLWDEWSTEDNAARRNRRAQQTPQDSGRTAVSHVAAISAAGVQKAEVELGIDSASAGSEEIRNDHHSQGYVEGRKPRDIDDRPKPTQAEAEHDRIAACHETVAASGSLAEALYSAVAAEFRTHRAQRGKPVPVGAELYRNVALALRATARSAEEVAAVLRAGVAMTEAETSERLLADCVTYAFTEDMERKLHASPGFVRQIQRLEVATEVKVYRQMRSDMLDALRTDLDDVWVKRRMAADDAQRRHVARLAMLHDVTWRTRRLRRAGLVPLFVSLMVELAILRPIIARQKAVGSAERTAINQRAARAAAELQSLRTDWRSITPEQYNDWLISRSRQTAAADVNNASSIEVACAPSPPKPEPARGTQDSLPADERRKAVVDVALVLIARGRYTDALGGDLGRLGSMSRTALWQSAFHRGRQDLGVQQPRELTSTAIQQLWTDALGLAKTHAWEEMISFMHELGRKRKRKESEKGSSARSDIT